MFLSMLIYVSSIIMYRLLSLAKLGFSRCERIREKGTGELGEFVMGFYNARPWNMGWVRDMIS